MDIIDDISELDDTNDTFIKEFEAALQNCLATLTKQESGTIESTQIKNNVEGSIQNFLDSAKRIEKFFIEKRYVLSIEKPEQFEKERLQEMKNDFQQKDVILRQHRLLLEQWQTTLNRLVAGQYPDSSYGQLLNSTTPTTEVGQTSTQNSGSTNSTNSTSSVPPPTTTTTPLPVSNNSLATDNNPLTGNLISSSNDFSTDIQNIPFM